MLRLMSTTEQHRASVLGMAIIKRFTQPIQVVCTPLMKAECTKIAEAESISLAAVFRRLIEAGLRAERL